MQTRAQSSLEAFVDFLFSILMNVGGQRLLYGTVATVGRITFFSSIFWSCTRSLRLIPQPDKPGKMLSLQHAYEGVLPWSRICFSTSSR